MTGTCRGHVLVFLGCVVSASKLHAAAPDASQPSAATATQNRAVAEALFRDGKALVASERFVEACAKFQESQRLDPALGTLLYLATCYAQIGKTASAWVAYQSAAELAHRAKDSARESLARNREKELEAKLSRLVFDTTVPVEGLQLRVDGLALGPGALTTPLPFDPGKHVIEASAPGKRTWSTTLELEQGPVTRVVKIASLQDAGTASSSSPEHAGSRGSAPDWRMPGYAALGVGVAGVALGAYFGIKAYAQSKDADRYCAGKFCTQQGLDGHESAADSAKYSNIGFAIGVVGVAAGAYLLYFQSPKPQSQTAFWVRAGAGQVSAGGAF